MATSANTTVKPVTSGSRAGAIGTVRMVVGEVSATDQNGVQRALHEGDRVSANDVIQTAANGAVDIQFNNNTHLDMGRDSQIALDNSVFDPLQVATDQGDIAAIQAAIAAGADPTTVVPPTAAGPGGVGDEGGSSFVVVDQLAARGLVTSGFDTAGGFAPPPVPPAETGALPAPAAETPPVVPPVVPPEVPPEITPPVVPPVDVPPVVPPVEVPPVEVPPVVTTPPAASDDAIVTNEDAAVAGSVVGNDALGSAGGNVWAIDTGASHGTVVVNPDGSYLYTPAANYNGPDSFTYKLTDADGNVSTATVAVTVNPVNDAPVALDNSYSVGQNKVLEGSTVLANDSDIDSPVLAARLLTQTEHGRVEFLPDGTFSYTPNPNYSGPDSFTYIANDGAADSNVATVSINVSAAPVGVKEEYALTAGSTLEVGVASGVLHNDTDKDTPQPALTAVLDTVTQFGTLTLLADGSFNYVPNAGFSGLDFFTYRASDGVNLSDATTVTLTVDPLLVAVSATMSGTEDTSLKVALDGSYTNGVVDKFLITSLPTDGHLFLANGSTAVTVGMKITASGGHAELVFKPDANESGGSAYADAGIGDQHAHYASFTYQALHGNFNHSSAATVLIDVAPVADPVTMATGPGPQATAGFQDPAVALHPLAVTFGDNLDHSEKHVIQLSNIDTGVTVSDGTHTFTASGATGHALDLFNSAAPGDNWNLATLSVKAPDGFGGVLNLTESATTTEIATGSVSTTSHDLTINYATNIVTGDDTANTLQGSAVNDILNGGPGDDLLGGGLGSDTFVYKSGDLGAGAMQGDHITDFNVAKPSAGGDVLDISDVLSQAGVSHAAFAGHEADFLKVSFTPAGNTAIQIDVDGAAAAHASVPLVTLDGVNATLNSLLGNGQIHGV